MTFFYSTKTWNSQPQISKETVEDRKHVANKSSWRITQLSNGFYQTEYQHPKEEDTGIDVTIRETVAGAADAIDGSVDNSGKKVAFHSAPKVVTAFK